MKLKHKIIAFLAVFLLLGCQSKEESKEIKTQPSNIEQNLTKNIEKNETSEVKNTKKKAVYDKQIALGLIDGSEFKFKIRDDYGLDVDREQKKATLFVFWATWCPPCRAEIPHLNNLAEKFRKDLNIVAILLEDKSVEQIKEFAKKNNIKYDVAVGKENFILEKAVGGITGLPASVLFKTNGDFHDGYVGLVPEEMLENEISKAIN
ncbi:MULTISPECIES: redoxin domain-containing protein [unclassified Campylobacter]|uniref:redoxin domain-containing protein n=1 Tax=unclassified Campylobacter TaxID=2593542 RepID=UPI003D359AED